MEECEKSGGHLLDYLSPDQFKSFSKKILLSKILSTFFIVIFAVRVIQKSKYKSSFWWTGATDFSKKEGEFSWEISDRALDNVAEELWVNASSHDMVGIKAGDSHQCVYLGPSNNTQEVLLDHSDCRDSVAKPLCQYLSK